MSDLAYKPVVTVADVLAAGACIEGVVERVEGHGGRIAGDPSKFDDEWIQKAANADGDGSGSGYGSGYGYGYGDGDGDGDGYGYGSGEEE